MDSAENSQAREHEAGDEFVSAHERLRRLEQRLDRASAAAERLIAEAAEAATRKPPRAGWQQREPDAGAGTDERGAGLEVELLLEAIQALRDRVPPELQRRVGEALREVLLALRALIDWYLERAERHSGEPSQARDIPIV